MYAAAMDLAVAPECILQEASLSQLQTLCFLTSSTFALLSALFQYMREWYGHGEANNGWTAPSKVASLRRAFASDWGLHSDGQLIEHPDKPKPVSVTDHRGLSPGRARWPDRDAPTAQQTQLHEPQVYAGRSGRLEAESKEGNETALEDNEPGFTTPQVPCKPQVLPFQKGWDLGKPAKRPSPDRPHSLPRQKRRPEQAPDAPPMLPFQKPDVESLGNLGDLGSDMPKVHWFQEHPLPGQHAGTAPEPSEWPLPFRDKYLPESLKAQDQAQLAAANDAPLPLNQSPDSLVGDPTSFRSPVVFILFLVQPPN